MTDLNNFGDMRAQSAHDGADALRAQARDLIAQAEAAERRGQAFAKGAAGERDIGSMLDELLVEGWIALHDRRVSTSSPANLDHLVVGPAGAFVIDTKNWTGGRVRLDDRGMAVAKWRKDDELHAVKMQGDVLAVSVQQVRPSTPCHAVMALVQDMGLERPRLHQDVVVLQREQLVDWLRALPACLTPGEVVAVFRELERRHPPRITPARRRAGSREQTPARRRPAPPTARRAVGRTRRQPVREVKRERERRALLVRVLALAVLFLLLTQTSLLNTLANAFGQGVSGVITEQMTSDPVLSPSPSG